jgi:hypothetical protein
MFVTVETLPLIAIGIPPSCLDTPFHLGGHVHSDRTREEMSPLALLDLTLKLRGFWGTVGKEGSSGSESSFHTTFNVVKSI